MEYIIVALLIGYIVFIHYQMNKKNRLIETMVEKLNGIEKSWDIKHILNQLEKHQLQQNTTTPNSQQAFR